MPLGPPRPPGRGAASRGRERVLWVYFSKPAKAIIRAKTF
ncbi:Hypothetical protein AA314_00982 [Archangium gephyra]|uniref:Uncharacterized protein n=1 Tax=Archangium gephyra TaxID=48 RepID=A0AAC8TCG5_9BACT|nr:Hypothetical protein AA314_00982 [Archangium gephyra]